MLTYKKMDVLDGDNGIIIHGCNCQGIMGAGVASAIRRRYPKVFEEYQALCNANSENPRTLLGQVQLIEVGEREGYLNQLYVANLFTQEYYGNPSRTKTIYAEPWAVEKCFDKIFSEDGAVSSIRAFYEPTVYMPKIGCGLGGLNWELQVEPLLRRIVTAAQVNVVVCEL